MKERLRACVTAPSTDLSNILFTLQLHNCTNLRFSFFGFVCHPFKQSGMEMGICFLSAGIFFRYLSAGIRGGKPLTALRDNMALESLFSV